MKRNLNMKKSILRRIKTNLKKKLYVSHGRKADLMPCAFMPSKTNNYCPVLQPVQNEMGTIANFLIRRATDSVKLGK